MRQKTIIALILLAATLLLYWQCAAHDFIILDDQLYVSMNPDIQQGLSWQGVQWAFSAVSTATTGNWHPVTWLSHMLDIDLFGLDPAGHHLVNVLLHAVNGVLLFLFLSRMTGALWRSAFVAALFALHPLHVESVAWVAERKDVLSTFFWMLTLLCYGAYVKRPGAARYLATFACLAVGLMAKPMLVSLPLIMLALDFWPLGRFQGSGTGGAAGEGSGFSGATFWKLLLEKIPFFGVALLFCGVALYAQNQGGYVPSFLVYPLRFRIYNALLSYCEYLSDFFFPHDLAIFYPFPVLDSLLPVAGALLLLIALSVGALLTLRRHPYLGVGWFWFLVTLLPVIGLVQVGSQSMADRYMYIPLVGVAMAVAWGIPALIPSSLRHPALLKSVAVCSLVACFGLTWRQLTLWRNSQTLLEHTVQVTQRNYFAHFLLGNYLFQQGKYQEALPHFLMTVRIKPDHEPAHYRIGMISMMNGDLGMAISHLATSLTISPNSERSANARVSLERCLKAKMAQPR
jgi:protein O-mannosyl-transferase